MEEVLIQIRQLEVAFGEKVVLDKIDLDIKSGETLAVIGPSGTGKSTIMKVLTGLLRPDAGSVCICGREINGCSDDEMDELRKKMGVVFQYSALFDFLNVGENVAFGLRRYFQLSEEEIAVRVCRLLEMVGMPDTYKMLPSELSGGMKKRIGLARALAMQPQIVFYDEPTAGLDPVMTMNITKLIRKMQKQLGITSVLITHDMQSAFAAADRIAMLYQGKIVELADAEAFKNSKNPIVQAFLQGLEYKKEIENGKP